MFLCAFDDENFQTFIGLFWTRQEHEVPLTQFPKNTGSDK